MEQNEYNNQRQRERPNNNGQQQKERYNDKRSTGSKYAIKFFSKNKYQTDCLYLNSNLYLKASYSFLKY